MDRGAFAAAGGDGIASAKQIETMRNSSAPSSGSIGYAIHFRLVLILSTGIFISAAVADNRVRFHCVDGQEFTISFLPAHDTQLPLGFCWKRATITLKTS